MFHLHPAPIEITLDDFNLKTWYTLLLGGIVNPFGPTFFGVGATQTGRTSNPRGDLVFFSFNPFSSTAQIVGSIDGGLGGDPAGYRMLHGLFQGISSPSFVCASKHLDEASRTQVLTEWFCSFEDAAERAALTMQFIGDPWNRVTREMEMAYEEPRRGVDYTAETIPQFIAASQTLEHFDPETNAFAFAWGGAIKHVAPALASNAMRPEVGLSILALLIASCHVPKGLMGR